MDDRQSVVEYARLFNQALPYFDDSQEKLAKVLGLTSKALSHRLYGAQRVKLEAIWALRGVIEYSKKAKK